MQLIDFLFGLFSDPDSAERFAADPEASLVDAGLGGVTGLDVAAAIPEVCDRLPAGQAAEVQARFESCSPAAATLESAVEHVVVAVGYEDPVFDHPPTPIEPAEVADVADVEVPVHEEPLAAPVVDEVPQERAPVVEPPPVVDVPSDHEVPAPPVDVADPPVHDAPPVDHQDPPKQEEPPARLDPPIAVDPPDVPPAKEDPPFQDARPDSPLVGERPNPKEGEPGVGDPPAADPPLGDAGDPPIAEEPGFDLDGAIAAAEAAIRAGDVGGLKEVIESAPDERSLAAIVNQAAVVLVGEDSPNEADTTAVIRQAASGLDRDLLVEPPNDSGQPDEESVAAAGREEIDEDLELLELELESIELGATQNAIDNIASGFSASARPEVPVEDAGRGQAEEIPFGEPPAVLDQPEGVEVVDTKEAVIPRAVPSDIQAAPTVPAAEPIDIATASPLPVEVDPVQIAEPEEVEPPIKEVPIEDAADVEVLSLDPDFN